LGCPKSTNPTQTTINFPTTTTTINNCHQPNPPALQQPQITATLQTKSTHKTFNYTTRVLPQPHRPAPPPPPNQIANNIQTTTTNNINILQLNIDGINTKIQTHSLYNTAYLVNEHTIHIAMIQESKLKGHSITPSIGDNSTEIRNDRKVSDGGGLITYIHKNISYIDTTKNTRALLRQQDKTI